MTSPKMPVWGDWRGPAAPAVPVVAIGAKIRVRSTIPTSQIERRMRGPLTGPGRTEKGIPTDRGELVEPFFAPAFGINIFRASVVWGADGGQSGWV